MTFKPLPLPAGHAEAFRIQADACASLGSPFTAALCGAIAGRGLPHSRTRERIAAWQGNVGPGGDSIPLRLAGALNRLVIDGAEPALAATYPPNTVDPETLHEAVCRAMIAQDDFLHDYLDSPPQTNETARSTAIAPGIVTACALSDLPVRLLEIGSSAGLNLLIDRFRCDYGSFAVGPKDGVPIPCEWRGTAAPMASAALAIAERKGCDIAPIDVADADQRRRLMSYVWPDQRARIDRLEAVLAIAASDPPPVERIGAAAWLTTELQDEPHGTHRIIFHTIMWQYMPQEEQERAGAAIRNAGAAASNRNPLSWLRLEADGETPGAALTLTQWNAGPSDGIDRQLARADFHGRWISWR